MRDRDLRSLEREALTNSSVGAILELEAAYERLGRSLDAHRVLKRHADEGLVRERVWERWEHDRRLVGLRELPEPIWERRFSGTRQVEAVTFAGCHLSNGECVDLETGEDVTSDPRRYLLGWKISQERNELHLEDPLGNRTEVQVKGSLLEGQPGDEALWTSWRHRVHCYATDSARRLSWAWTHDLPQDTEPQLAIGSAERTLLYATRWEGHLARQHLHLLGPTGETWTYPLSGLSVRRLVDGKAILGDERGVYQLVPYAQPKQLFTGQAYELDVSPRHVSVRGEDQLALLRRPGLELEWRLEASVSQDRMSLGTNELYWAERGRLNAVDLDTQELLWTWSTRAVSRSETKGVYAVPGGLLILVGNKLVRLGPSN